MGMLTSVDRKTKTHRVLVLCILFVFCFISELGHKFFLDAPIDTRSATFVSVVSTIPKLFEAKYIFLSPSIY